VGASNLGVPASIGHAGGAGAPGAGNPSNTGTGGLYQGTQGSSGSIRVGNRGDGLLGVNPGDRLGSDNADPRAGGVCAVASAAVLDASGGDPLRALSGELPGTCNSGRSTPSVAWAQTTASTV
jgi:hypothetical protein